MNESVFAVAVLLAVVNRSIVEYLAAPVRAKFPQLDLWWLVYVSFVAGVVLGLGAGVNLFDQIAGLAGIGGRILTGALIGGGASLLHDVAKRRNEQPAA